MGSTNAERQARWRARRNALAKQALQQSAAAAGTANTALKTENDALRAEIQALRNGGGLAGLRADQVAVLVKELAAAKARIAELEAGRQKLLDEMQSIVGARFASKQRTVKPKAEKPPLPPDEERERIIKGLKTRVRNLSFELHATRDLNTKIALRTGAMDFRTSSAIAKALHPDRKPSEEEWEPLRDQALKLFTSWKADNSKAHRRAKQ